MSRGAKSETLACELMSVRCLAAFFAPRAKRTAVLERHRLTVEQRLGTIQSKILASDARLSHRLTGRTFSSRWLEVIALTCTLRRWQDILGARRLSVLVSKQQENAAILIQRAWRAHVSRMSDVKRTLSMAILRRNFRVLFFKHRIKRRVRQDPRTAHENDTSTNVC